LDAGPSKSLCCVRIHAALRSAESILQLRRRPGAALAATASRGRGGPALRNSGCDCELQTGRVHRAELGWIRLQTDRARSGARHPIGDAKPAMLASTNVRTIAAPGSPGRLVSCVGQGIWRSTEHWPAHDCKFQACERSTAVMSLAPNATRTPVCSRLAQLGCIDVLGAGCNCVPRSARSCSLCAGSGNR